MAGWGHFSSLADRPSQGGSLHGGSTVTVLGLSPCKSHAGAVLVQYGWLIRCLPPACLSAAGQDVLRTLMVNCVEFRSEEDADVAPYCHSKDVEVMEVDVGAGVQAALARLHAAMLPVIQQLVELRVGAASSCRA